MSGAYRPTCPNAPIPPDAIAGVKAQIHTHVKQGEIITATAQMEARNDWLHENGQYNDSEIKFLYTLTSINHAQELATTGNITDAVKTYQ